MMIGRSRAVSSLFRRARLSTLVATEEFPFAASLSPLPPSAAVVKSSKLGSGIQTITRDYNSSIVSLKFSIGGGSSTETTEQKGAAQFLASAAYVGTNDESGIKLVRTLEDIGASFTAYSDKEKIVYDVKVLPDQVETAVSVVMSAIGSPPHAAYVLEENKPKAQVDYNKFAVDSSAQLQELIEEAAFGEVSPLGASVFAHNLAKLSVPSVMQYRATHFVRSNVVVAGSGISQADLDALVEQEAGKIPEGVAAALPASAYVGGDVKVRTDPQGPSHLGVAFPVPAGDAAKPYQVLQALIGMKLGQEKVCATTFASTYAGSAGGLFGVQAAGSADEATSFLTMALGELKSIASKCPDIEVVKRKLTLDNFLALEGEDTAGSLLSAHAAGADPVSAGDLRGVTTAQVSAAAAAALKSAPAYAVLGATAGTPSYSSVTNMLK